MLRNDSCVCGLVYNTLESWIGLMPGSQADAALHTPRVVKSGDFCASEPPETSNV